MALAQAVGLALLRAWAPELPRAPWGQTGCAASQTLPVLQPGLRPAVARAQVLVRAKGPETAVVPPQLSPLARPGCGERQAPERRAKRPGRAHRTVQASMAERRAFS